MFSGTQVHEFFHDARHLLGFPATKEADMIGKLLFKGMIAGILAGLVAFAFAHTISASRRSIALSGLKKVWPLIHTNTARRLTAVKKRCLAVKPSPGSG